MAEIKCPKCDFMTPFPNVYEKHMKWLHDRVEEDNADDNDNNNEDNDSMDTNGNQNSNTRSQEDEQKTSEVFSCAPCRFKTTVKYMFDKHLTAKSHVSVVAKGIKNETMSIKEEPSIDEVSAVDMNPVMPPPDTTGTNVNQSNGSLSTSNVPSNKPLYKPRARQSPYSNRNSSRATTNASTNASRNSSAYSKQAMPSQLSQPNNLRSSLADKYNIPQRMSAFGGTTTSGIPERNDNLRTAQMALSQMKSTMANLPFPSTTGLTSAKSNLRSSSSNLLSSSPNLLNGSSLRSKYLSPSNGIGSLQSKYLPSSMNSNLEMQALKSKLGLDSLTSKYLSPTTGLDALKSRYLSPNISGLGLDSFKSKMSRNLSGLGLDTFKPKVSSSLSGLGLDSSKMNISRNISGLGLDSFRTKLSPNIGLKGLKYGISPSLNGLGLDFELARKLNKFSKPLGNNPTTLDKFKNKNNNITSSLSSLQRNGGINKESNTLSKYSMPISLNCSNCSYTTTTAEGLTRHIKAFHRNTQSYMCIRCGEKFPMKQVLDYHIKNCKGNKFSQGSQNNTNETNNPRMSLSTGNMMDSLKRLSTNSPPSMVSNRLNISNDEISCDHCEFKTLSIMILQNHMLSHQKQQQMSYMCSKCNSKYFDKKEFDHHVSTCKSKSINPVKSGKVIKPLNREETMKKVVNVKKELNVKKEINVKEDEQEMIREYIASIK